MFRETVGTVKVVVSKEETVKDKQDLYLLSPRIHEMYIIEVLRSVVVIQ